MRISEDLAVNSLEVIASSNALKMVRQLPESKMWALVAVHKPPSGSTNGSGTDISTNSHVTEEKCGLLGLACRVMNVENLPEEQPSGDKTFIGFTWWFGHDVKIRWVEAQSGSWETVSNL